MEYTSLISVHIIMTKWRGTARFLLPKFSYSQAVENLQGVFVRNLKPQKLQRCSVLILTTKI